jgi:glycosyltransferase involved in cell wall biosynthesis
MFVMNQPTTKSSKQQDIAAQASGRLHPQVIVGATYWVLNGVNIFSANLVRGLCGQGIPAQILLTEEDTALVQVSETRMSRPADVPFDRLPVGHRTSWGGHWGAMIRYLEERAPCIYIPNSDWRHSCVAPLLSNKVKIVGIVHSDDPLHYDHVSRLGDYWDAIVATSKTIADKTAALKPSLADRIVVIPIGVDIPSAAPKERPSGDRPLRVIYHGVLRQQQKRILDLPKIIADLAARKMPVELSIAGSGPDQDRLQEACKEWVEQGLIRFLGIVPHETIFELLEQNDVYILTSEFEGMPNALLEAMGRGCVPVVTDMESAIPQLVRDGANGFVVPIGDIGAFADRLSVLQRDHSLRRHMALGAYGTVDRGKYRTQDMLQDYIEVFDRVLSGIQSSRFQRPAGDLTPPPAEIGSVSIFPVDLLYSKKGLGHFPSWPRDYREFKEQIRLLEDPRVRSLKEIKPRPGWHNLKNVQVIVGTPAWTYTGVNEFSANLVRGLRRRGIGAEVLLTEEDTDLVSITEPRMPRPSDIPFVHLPVDRTCSWGGRWGAMIRYLEERAPCIYLPNYDWRHSCVSPLLSNRVAIVGIAHQDDSLYYDHVQRLGRYWNAIIAISNTIARNIRSAVPDLMDRVGMIPHGLNIPIAAPNRSIDPAGALTMACLGTLDDNELRAVSDLVRNLRQRQVPIKVELIAATGKSKRDILGHFPEPEVLVFDDLPQEAILDLFKKTDLCVFASKFEGVGNRLAEAMGQGCIPIVLDAACDPEQLIKHLDNGFALSETNVDGLTNSLVELHCNPRRRGEMSRRADGSMRARVYPCSEMIDDYMEVFSSIVDEIDRGTFHRLAGTLRPPPAQVNGVNILPIELSCNIKRLGLFPSHSPDYKQFKAERRRDKFRLFGNTGTWFAR